MKTVTVTVPEKFVVPKIYETRHPELIAGALEIGAYAVEHLTTTEHDDIREVLKTMAKMKEEYETDLDRHREEARNKLAAEKIKIRESVESEIRVAAKREAIESQREALLAERERHAADREALMTRLEERHASHVSSSSAQLEEARSSLRQLRTEHEGLVLKLITRLEPSSGRGGTGATSSAAALGRTFEENVARHLREVFGARPGFQLEDVHATGHSGDLLMIFDGLRILVELKSYDPKTRVPTKEVEKLARDLTEVQPPCNAAIMISACSEITGYYSCGPLEVSTTVACVPVLFINNFLGIGEPSVTLHMTRVFLSMVESKTSSLEDLDVGGEGERMAECARRCTGYLTDLSKQSSELLRQVAIMKTTAIKLRETVISFVETEVARYNGILQLMTRKIEVDESREERVTLDRTVFVDPSTMSASIKSLAVSLSEAYDIGDHRQQCTTKELLIFIQEIMKLKSEKAAREVLKSLFLDSVVKHGHVVGVSRKAAVSAE